MKHRGLYITLFALTVLLLAFPAVQQHAKLFKFWPLRGATVTTEQPRFTLKSFMDGSFQAQEDRYLSDHIGFREPFVRCYNQLCWSLFRKTQNKTVYVGKDNWLFNDYTIKHHYGQSIYDFGESNEAACLLADAVSAPRGVEVVWRFVFRLSRSGQGYGLRGVCPGCEV